MTSTEEKIKIWHFAKFGREGTPEKTLKKLHEEIGELVESVMNNSPESIMEEAGDVGIILSHLVRQTCPETPSLQEAIEGSLKKIEHRLEKEKINERDSDSSTAHDLGIRDSDNCNKENQPKTEYCAARREPPPRNRAQTLRAIRGLRKLGENPTLTGTTYPISQ